MCILPRSVIETFKRFTLKKALLYALAVGVPFGLENAPKILNVNPGESSNPWVSTLVLYQWVVTVGPRKPRAHFVHIVMIDRRTEPDEVTSETSPCPQRDFMARLLRTLAAANPAVIAIDKYYGRGCKPEESAALLDTMRDVSQTLPLVILRYDRSDLDLQGRDTGKLHVLNKRDAVVATKTMDVDIHVKYGLKTLNADERKIPLQWPVISEDHFDHLSASELAKEPLAFEPTFATSVVKEYDPSTVAEETIQSFITRDVNPFTSFLNLGQIAPSSAIDLICGQEHARDLDWHNCAPPNGGGDLLKNLRNRVVVIGQNDPRDIHNTVVGEVPGVILQANYIESLLDDRYLKPSSLWIQLLISIAWVLVVEYFFDQYDSRPDHALLLSAASIAALWLITYDIAVVQLGHYLVLWPPSVVAMLSRYAILKFKPKPVAAMPPTPVRP
jgi:CHASE2 domain-containing sensor protein